MKNVKYGILMTALFTMAGCQIVQQSEKDAEQIANRPLPQQAITDLGYSTNPPVKSIPQWTSLYNWQPVDDYSLIIWPNAFTQYLLTVDEGCHELSMAQGIGLTNTEGEILANFDSVIANGTCRINKIYPLTKTNNN
jgi:hypothetical protein